MRSALQPATGRWCGHCGTAQRHHRPCISAVKTHQVDARSRRLASRVAPVKAYSRTVSESSSVLRMASIPLGAATASATKAVHLQTPGRMRVALLLHDPRNNLQDRAQLLQLATRSTCPWSRRPAAASPPAAGADRCRTALCCWRSTAGSAFAHAAALLPWRMMQVASCTASSLSAPQCISPVLSCCACHYSFVQPPVRKVACGGLPRLQLLT